MSRIAKVRTEIHGDDVKVITYKRAARGRFARLGVVTIPRQGLRAAFKDKATLKKLGWAK